MSLEVLVVDQDRELARLYCRFLADHGFSARAAASGEDCVTLLFQRDPAVLVLDRELPAGEAREILARLRSDGEGPPVLLTTWTAPPETLPRLVEPPVVLCLRKFFPLPALLEAVRRILRAPLAEGYRAREANPGDERERDATPPTRPRGDRAVFAALRADPTGLGRNPRRGPRRPSTN